MSCEYNKHRIIHNVIHHCTLYILCYIILFIQQKPEGDTVYRKHFAGFYFSPFLPYKLRGNLNRWWKFQDKTRIKVTTRSYLALGEVKMGRSRIYQLKGESYTWRKSLSLQYIYVSFLVLYVEISEVLNGQSFNFAFNSMQYFQYLQGYSSQFQYC